MRSMITRVVILVLTVILAIPVTALTPSGNTSQAPWSDVAVAAKGKKHKKHQKPGSRAVSRTERQPVTQTFTSTQALAILNGATGIDIRPASPYPSAIKVSGLNNGVITDVNLILSDLTHSDPGGLDILLASSDGRRALVMSDRGNVEGVMNIDLMIDDEAAVELPDRNLTSGTYRPTNSGPDFDDGFEPPAPAPNGNLNLNAFDGANPNATTNLWVMDDGAGDVGSIACWPLQITAEADVEVKQRVSNGKDAKNRGKHKRAC